MSKISRVWTWPVLLTLLALLLGSCDFLGGPTPTPTPAPTPIPGSAQVTATLTTYNDPGGRFTIGYPPSWEIGEGDSQVEFRDDNDALHIMVQCADAGQTLDVVKLGLMVDSYFSNQDESGVSGFKQEVEDIRDDGSILLDYSFATSSGTGYGRTLFEQHGTIVYILSYWVMQQDLWAVNQPFFDTIVATFQPTP